MHRLLVASNIVALAYAIVPIVKEYSIKVMLCGIPIGYCSVYGISTKTRQALIYRDA